MTRTIDDFVGSYTISHGEGSFTTSTGQPLIQIGDQLNIGTGQHGDPPSDGIRVGLSIVGSSGQLVLPAIGSPPAFAYFGDGTLNGSSYFLDGKSLPQLMTYQLSLMTLSVTAGLYRAVTILITIGDPENAGVWAADDQSGG